MKESFYLLVHDSLIIQYSILYRLHNYNLHKEVSFYNIFVVYQNQSSDYINILLLNHVLQVSLLDHKMPVSLVANSLPVCRIDLCVE